MAFTTAFSSQIHPSACWKSQIIYVLLNVLT